MTTVPWLQEEVNGTSSSRLRASITADRAASNGVHGSPHLGAQLGEKALAWGRGISAALTDQVTHRRSRHRAMPSCKTPIERSPPWPSGSCDVHWQGDPLAHLAQFRQLGQAIVVEPAVSVRACTASELVARAPAMPLHLTYDTRGR